MRTTNDTTTTISVEIRKDGMSTKTVNVAEWATILDCFNAAGLVYEDWTCGGIDYASNFEVDNGDVLIINSKQIKQG